MNNKNLIRKLEVLTFENNRLSKEIEQNRLLRQSYLHIHRTIENYEEDLMELIDNLIGYNPYRRKEITKVRIRLQRIFNVMLYYYKSEALQGETKKDLHRLKRLFPSLSKMEL